MAAAQDTLTLWQDYRRSQDQHLRDRLILTYAPLVKFVAGRVGASLPSHVDEQDLVSYGLLGLIGAIERYDPDRDVKFETYAITRIKGAIIDELRSLDWVPRSVRARAREVERAHAKLENSLQRAPTDQEMADELGITVDELNDSLLAISHSSMVALDELWSVSDSSGDQVSLMDTIEDPGAPDPARALDVGDLKDRIAESIAKLPEREKLVIALYYYENLTLREIGEVLGVTESRVSQMHTKAVLRLRSRMQEELGRLLAQEDLRDKTMVLVTHSIEESVLLSDRIVVLTRRPGRVKANIEVTLPRPRDESDPRFVALKHQIRDLIHDEFEIEA